MDSHMTGMPISISETSRKVGDEREPQEVMGEKESSDEFKVNMMQITEKEVTSPGSVESEQGYLFSFVGVWIQYHLVSMLMCDYFF